jgi:hypothetical protein
MSLGPISSIASNYLQSILGTQRQNSGLSTNSTSASSPTQKPDSQQLSPFAQLMSELQQLQQSDPSKYQQVTQQISSNLQSAAQTAQSEGNKTAANNLTQLSTDFANASKNGQLPNVQDLAQAVGGHHHHHHSHAASSSSSSSSDQTLSQLVSALQSNSSQSDPLDPMTIMTDTLQSAGIGSSNS